jgi:CrcB protein
MARFGSLLAVAVGGATGSLARWGLLVQTGEDASTLTLFGLNVFGSLLLGGLIAHRERLSNEVFALLGTGFAGGLTTFSTFAVAVAQKLEDGELLDAFSNSIATLVTTLVAAGLGYRLVRLSGARARSAPRLRKIGRSRR